MKKWGEWVDCQETCHLLNVTLLGESQADHQERVFSNEDPFFISRKLPLIDIGVFMLLR